MARSLTVFLKESRVGTLEQDDYGALWFAYSPEYLAAESPVALSASLPLRSERFKQREARPFFAGLLPEEDVRRLTARALGVSDRNDFSILERIGAECAGAVSLLMEGETPNNTSGEYSLMDETQFAAKLRELPRRPLLAGDEGIRLSLAGAQNKVAIKIENGEFLLPMNGAASTHIIKPESAHYHGLVENEFFCMRLAANTGLDVASVELGNADGISFLQVARYDRKGEGRDLERIHQEDFCQALGIVPERKYQQEQGPGLKECFTLIRQISSVSGPDVLKLFDAVVFNYLIGNCDAHGKNFSILYHGSEARLAPLYDLVSTEVYPEVSKSMAMKIGGEKFAERVYAREWREFFADAGLGASPAIRRIKALAAKVKVEAEKIETLAGGSVVAPIVIANCERLLGSFDSP